MEVHKKLVDELLAKSLDRQLSRCQEVSIPIMKSIDSKEEGGLFPSIGRRSGDFDKDYYKIN